jgi:hypothetical protein
LEGVGGGFDLIFTTKNIFNNASGLTLRKIMDAETSSA